MSDGSIACTLSAEALRERRRSLLPMLATRASSRVPTAGGISFSFPAEAGLLPVLTELVEAERQCCRFMRFVLTVEPDDGGIHLEIGGPPGTREFLEELLDPGTDTNVSARSAT